MASRYQKLTQREHVLHRPETYVGQVEKDSRQEWVFDEGKTTKRAVSYSPAFFKIFDEILTNAADSYNRDGSMKTLKVEIGDVISVWNDGRAIPIEMHDEGVYVPELIFGHLLAGENYDDTDQRAVGGRNGLGAKLTNVFSKKFEVEICDGKKKYKQTWTNNMSKVGKPKISDKECASHVFVRYEPEYEKFGMTGMDDDTKKMLERRVYDMAAVLGKAVKITLGKKRVEVKSFDEYITAFVGPKVDVPRQIDKVSGWDVGIALTEEFDQVSFVNAVHTSSGGTHVNGIVDQVSKAVVEAAAKKKITVKSSVVKTKMFVFVNARVINPTFTTQSKETLTSKTAKVTLSDAFVKKCVGMLLEPVIAEATVRASLADERTMKKTDGSKKVRVSGIPKLSDASWAGTKNGGMCTLVLTEGDSAKTLAISGLSVVGRDRYGVFSLRGKLLNTREASASSIANNAEITAIKQILGLQSGKTYTDTSSLRYGHVMLMTDADTDGSHITGLVLNFFHSCFPSLIELPGFFKGFITPVVKVTKGSNTISFYSLPEYEQWKSATTDHHRWTTKYYKGLGTSTSKDAKEYFSQLKKHVKTYTWDEFSSECVDKAFNKSRASDRKDWISAFEHGHHLDNAIEEVPISHFIDKELILFSRADIERSIPSVVDGLKPSQRKVLYAAFKRNMTSDTKVAQFSGYAAEHSAYHHGEASLQGTIVNMAQDYVGSNNINWLVPSGQFGTRLMGGKDSASARYIFTRLNKITRTIFVDTDDKLLKYLDDDGFSIEPNFYVPIVPTLLVNGTSGIGTGWSTDIPNYDPRDIVANVRRLISGETMMPMVPFYRGFKGVIEETELGSYVTRGVYTISGKSVIVTELPIFRWTQDYKEYLDGLLEKKIITDFREKHTDVDVHFEIDFVGVPDIKLLKLESTIRTSNMHAFDPSGKIKKYSSPLEILEEWFVVRKNLYVARKRYLLADLKHRAAVAANKYRFISMINNDELIVNKKSEQTIVKELHELEFYKVEKKYEYMLSMKISSLTVERAEALKKEAEELNAQLVILENTTETQMWNTDLERLI